MDTGFIERRRSPRVSVTSGAVFVRPVSMAVRLLDLSSEGLLMSCPDPLRLGATTKVIARLAGRSLDAEIDVRHVSTRWDQRIGGYRVGGRFLSLGPQARLAIERLLSGSQP
jgi:c-di-GMP-binding flagellar brake protein YcgR